MNTELREAVEAVSELSDRWHYRGKASQMDDTDTLLDQCADQLDEVLAPLLALLSTGEKAADRWATVRLYASGENFDEWEGMARGGHVPSDDGNTYADNRADRLAALTAPTPQESAR